MSKGLEALEEIKGDMEYATRLDFVEPIVRGEVRENLFKIYHRELPHLDTIEKELKALEIIKEKGLSTNELWFIKNDRSFEDYTETMKELYWGDETIEKELKTKEEFDLLKEVMK